MLYDRNIENHMEVKWVHSIQIPSFFWKVYDNYTLTEISVTKKINNSGTSMARNISEENKRWWKKDKRQLVGANSITKHFVDFK